MRENGENPTTYAPGPHLTEYWRITKPAARGRRGVVVSQAAAAAEVGIAVLDAGGNAADAAVAGAFALAAVEPWNSGLGGEGFAIVHPAGAAKGTAVDFGPVAPRALDPSRFHLTGRMWQGLFTWPEVENNANIHGPLSFVIPSAVAGYAALHEQWGRLPLADIMAPAVALAHRGVPADWMATLKIAGAASSLRLYPESNRIYLPGGIPPVAPYQGEPAFLSLGNLAATMERLQRAGLRDFYEGEVAASMVADVKELGGLLSAEDLRSCRACIRSATEVTWGGERALELSGGLDGSPIFARALGQLHTRPAPRAPDASWYVSLARALKSAYAERLAGAADIEVQGPETCTTHLSVCDSEGGMVALTSTLVSSMGSRVVLPGTGVLMNDGIALFDPCPGRPNSMASGKRPVCNMCPSIIRDGGRPWLVAGASGGRRILSAVLQMLCFVADFGMDPEAAAHYPRIDVSEPGKITVDRRLAPAVLKELANEGSVETVEHGMLPAKFACPNLIESRADGSRVGISDVMSPSSAALAQGKIAVR